MESRTFQLLEFPKVLRALSALAVSSAGASSCLAQKPLSDPLALAIKARLLEQAQAFTRESGFSLTEFPALDAMLSALVAPSRMLDQDDLFALLRTLEQARVARDALAEGDSRGLDDLVEMVLRSPWPGTAYAGVRRCLDDEGAIRDESSPGLMSVRTEIRQIHQRCTRKVQDFIRGEDLSRFLQDEFMTVSSDRYVLALKANFKGRLQGIIHDYSQTGETCYFEPLFLVELNNSLQELKQEERREEKKVLEFLTGLVRQEQDSIRACYGMLVELDVLLAKVRLAAAFDGRALALSSGAAPRLKSARHPLLALGGEGARPVDIELLPGQSVLIVSGGNAGGKTVCLKTLGLIALMALSGLPVPVGPDSVLPPWRKVFVVLGDEQSLEDHVSTFTAQIQYLSRVFGQVDQDTLFLLDEFGAGTDPTQGAALAQAVVDSLLERNAMALIATHFPALKAYALATRGVRAASVLFDPGTKKPLFSLAYDQVGASIALDVAREHGLPEDILARAQQYLLLDGSDTSAVLDRLNAQAVERERELAGLKDEKERLRKKRASLDAEFMRERKALMAEIKAQAQAVLLEWKKERISRKQALKKLSDARERLAAPMAQDRETDSGAGQGLSWDQVAPGSQVRYLAWGRNAVVQEKNDKRRQLKIDLDGVALWVREEDVAPAQGGSARQAPARPPAPVQEATAPAVVVDLRGLRSDEAVAVLARSIDTALLRGSDRLEVVHGRGTGALRREVHEFLKASPAVEGFVLAPEDRGGDGMTEVTLK